MCCNFRVMKIWSQYGRTISIVLLLLLAVIGMAEFRSRWEWAALHQHANAKALELYFWAAVTLFVGTFVYLVVEWLYRKWLAYQQLKHEYAQAKLALLRSQLDPHFFFNTLNNLYGLSVEGAKETPGVILQLADMMRYTLYEGAAERVPLKRELEYLRQYIALHQLRYQKEVEIDMNVEVGEQEYEIPPLLLIVLLENAFKHGVERMLDRAFLHIGVAVHQKELVYTVENNFDPAEDKKASGIGLSNLRKRLDLLYPAKHQLEIEKKEDIFFAQLKLKLS